jgi:hypothetical protein
MFHTKRAAAVMQHQRNRQSFGSALLLLCCIAGGLCLWQPVWLFHSNGFRVTRNIVSHVQAFRKSHGRLPETLADVGIAAPNLMVYYDKLSSDEYRVWFGTTLGESEVDDSRTGKWQ